MHRVVEAERPLGYAIVFSNQFLIKLFRKPLKLNSQALGAYLKLFFILCNNLCTLNFDDPEKKQGVSALLKKFRKLLDLQHARWHTATEYADALNVSSDHLNRFVKSLVGRTVKEMIQSRIVMAAKRLLYFSDLSAKEFGYSLGFSEPANFSSFFRNSAPPLPASGKPANIGF